MFQPRLNQYECDQCNKLIPRSHPVVPYEGHQFCSPDCVRYWLEDRADAVTTETVPYGRYD